MFLDQHTDAVYWGFQCGDEIGARGSNLSLIARGSLYGSSLCHGRSGDEGIVCFYCCVNDQLGTCLWNTFGDVDLWTEGNHERWILSRCLYRSRCSVYLSLCKNEIGEKAERSDHPKITLKITGLSVFLDSPVIFCRTRSCS